MEFRILGPLEVVEDGHALDAGGAKQRALLAVLLLNANRVVSSDGLIDALWEERAPGTAATYKELAHRAGDGLGVFLLWSPTDGRLTVMVDDAKAQERFALDAPPDKALDVFNHPYAYASRSASALAA